MKLGFRRGEKGFTLVELMVVMAIMAVLATIVIPAVTGTKQVSSDTQVKQDATVVETAVGDYNADANAAEQLTTTTPAVVGESTTSQITSNKWPEKTISVAYAASFPTSTANVTSVTIMDNDGTTLYATGGATGKKLANFVLAYNAIDIDALVSGGYLQEEPNGVDLTFSSTKQYHNYLWLVKKVLVGDDADGGRSVTVFSLTTVIASGSTDALIYQQIN